MRDVLVVLGVLGVLSVAGCSTNRVVVAPNPSLERMVVQPGHDVDVVRAGATPPEGTVAWDDVEDDPAVLTGRRGGVVVDAIPIPVDDALLARGRRQYDVHCSPCHGLSGYANTPVANNMGARHPPSLQDALVRDMPDGRIFAAIIEGYGLMPSYASRVRPRDAWAIVAYTRALQLSQEARVDELPADVRDRALAVLGAP